MSRIGVLGWGSLVHHPEGQQSSNQQPLQILGAWRLVGPVLPLEYSRISDDGRLTLVVDPQHGVCNRVFVVESALTNLAAARENLRLREGSTRRSWIGYVEKTENVSGASLRADIAQWVANSQFDAVIWTAIPDRFEEVTGAAFTPEAGVNYLNSLKGEQAARAFRYLAETPDEIRTPLRQLARWPEAVAVHEAGHFIVSCILGWRAIRLSRVPVDDRTGEPAVIGCRYADTDSPHAVAVACALAGPWAQLLHMPDSIASQKRSVFETGILRPASQHSLYSWTAWVEDVTQVLHLKAASPGIAQLAKIPTSAEIDQLDQRVGAFFRRNDTMAAVALVRDALMAESIITDPALTKLRESVLALFDQASARDALLAGL